MLTYMDRRSFLGAASAVVAAPYVIRNSGILMPIKRLILPTGVTHLEGSFDGNNWTSIARHVGYEGAKLDPINFPIKYPYKFHRVVFEREWRPAGETTASATLRYNA